MAVVFLDVDLNRGSGSLGFNVQGDTDGVYILDMDPQGNKLPLQQEGKGLFFFRRSLVCARVCVQRAGGRRKVSKDGERGECEQVRGVIRCAK